MKTAYATDKALYHRQPLALLAQGLQPYPVHVQIILSDLCNHNCSFCSYRNENYTTNELFHVLRDDGSKNHNPNRMIPSEKVLEILADCHTMGVKAIQFTGGGEPTLHPQFGPLLRTAQEMGFQTAVVSNGDAWGDWAPYLARCQWVRVSIDAGTKETWSKVRRVSAHRFEKVWDNLRCLLIARDRKKCAVGVGFVVTQENWREIGWAVCRAAQSGVDNIRISAVFQEEGAAYFESFHDEAVRLIEDARRRWQRDDFQLIDLFSQRVDDLRAHPDYDFCGFQHFTTYIGGDLNVYRCCNLAYHPRGLLGSLTQQSFKQLWDGPEKQQRMENFNAMGCPRCQFNDKNKAIIHELRKETPPAPPHVNFV